MHYPRRIEGYAIVSEDGMLANASGMVPDQRKFEADQRFFERGLDGVDVVVHGRHSHERQRRSDLRRRLILTRKVPAMPMPRLPPSDDNNFIVESKIHCASPCKSGVSLLQSNFVSVE